jgi:hypothetical protein
MAIPRMIPMSSRELDITALLFERFGIKKK